MIPTVKLASTPTPDGGEMTLYQHDKDFLVKVNGNDLMNSRQHESELALARLGCAHTAGKPAARVLVGGLGLGYTLRKTLDMLGPKAEVYVGELLPAVIDWNRQFLAGLNDNPLADPRAIIKVGDVVDLIARCADRFDAILLDIDNGPDAMTHSRNHRLYKRQGIEACRRALRRQGCLAVWSAEASKPFEQLLVSCEFHVRRYRVPAYPGSKSRFFFIWIATENEDFLPPGGGKPRAVPPPSRKPRRRKRH